MRGEIELWMHVTTDTLYHHGIKGQRWGVKNGPPYPLDDSDYSASEKKKRSPKNKSKNGERDFSYAKTSNASVRINKDGSKTFPKGFVFNRVGKASTDVNRSGALYVSYGKEDAARYVKNLGTTPIRKLFGVKADTLQHITVKKELRMPSDVEVAKTTAKVLLNNDAVFNTYQKSLYATIYTGDFNKKVTREDVAKALKNPHEKEGQKLAYTVNSFFGDPKYANETKAIYEYYRKQGYDAIPDSLDRMGGTSKTGMIVINPDKVSLTSSTSIGKDVMKDAKGYVRKLGKLPVSEVVNS